jgi:hypothetical protein
MAQKPTQKGLPSAVLRAGRRPARNRGSLLAICTLELRIRLNGLFWYITAFWVFYSGPKVDSEELMPLAIKIRGSPKIRPSKSGRFRGHFDTAFRCVFGQILSNSCPSRFTIQMARFAFLSETEKKTKTQCDF